MMLMGLVSDHFLMSRLYLRHYLYGGSRCNIFAIICMAVVVVTKQLKGQSIDWVWYWHNWAGWYGMTITVTFGLPSFRY